MDWGLAYHPYSVPLTEPEFWDDSQTGLITWDYNSPIINFANLELLTNYFSQSHLLDSKGEVRPIILSEQGFTSKSASRERVRRSAGRGIRLCLLHCRQQSAHRCVYYEPSG